MTPSEIVKRIREKTQSGEWVISTEAAMGLIYAFSADEKEKDGPCQGQLF